MDLIFTKSETGKSWVAEFEATADFNIHLEREKVGMFEVYQRTSGGGWALVDDLDKVYPQYKDTIDYDFTSLVYPKYIKIVSGPEPSYTVVSSAGDITEIKSQDKSVEVTSNGTIDVTPDAGFAYLNSVKVRTNVAQSGEGGGSTGGGGSAFQYYKLNWDSPLSGNMGVLFLYGGQFIVNSAIIDNSNVIINAGVAVLANTAYIKESLQSVKAIITCPFPLEIDGELKTYTIEQFFAQMGAEGSAMLEALLIPITEEEYYNKETYA